MPYYITHWERNALERGLEQGREEAKIEDAKKMLARGFDVALISEITDLPPEKIEEIKRTRDRSM